MCVMYAYVTNQVYLPSQATNYFMLSHKREKVLTLQEIFARQEGFGFDSIN